MFGSLLLSANKDRPFIAFNLFVSSGIKDLRAPFRIKGERPEKRWTEDEGKNEEMKNFRKF